MSFLLSKNMLFSIKENIKRNNLKKREYILCKQFYWPPDNFLKQKILTPGAMKTHIQISYKEGKSEGRRCVLGL